MNVEVDQQISGKVILRTIGHQDGVNSVGNYGRPRSHMCSHFIFFLISLNYYRLNKSLADIIINVINEDLSQEEFFAFAASVSMLLSATVQDRNSFYAVLQRLKHFGLFRPRPEKNMMDPNRRNIVRTNKKIKKNCHCSIQSCLNLSLTSVSLESSFLSEFNIHSGNKVAKRTCEKMLQTCFNC